MMRPSSRAMLASLLLILSSLAGCVGTEDLGGEETTESLGTVVVSTYHVEQLVTAVGGGLVDVELISTGNIPVHDYTPTAQDLIRLGEADLFLYHGLGLEPWVNATLDSMGDDAPAAAMTHAMPAGQTSLDYETILIDQLCESLNGAMEIVDLTEDEDEAPEFDGDNAAYTLELPHHDDEGHDMDDHDEEHHDEEGDHEEHDEHDHLEAEETLDASSACPSGTAINLYHFEPGHYVLEFEAEDMEMFNVAIAMMGGAHNHAHDHDEEGHDEDDHDEDDHDEDDHDEDDEDDHDEHGHDDDDHMDDMSAEEMFNAVDANNDSMVNWTELSAWMLDGHDDDHDDHHDENGTSSGNESGNGTADGNATADDDHDHDEDEHDHEMEEIEMALESATIEHMFGLSDANDDGSLDLTEFTSLFDRVEAMEDDMPDLDTMAAVFMTVFDENDDGMLSVEEFTELAEFMMMDEGEEHHDDEHDHGNESGDEDHEEMNATEMAAMMMMMFDANNDSSLSLEELEMFMSMGMEEDHHEVAFMKLDIEVEGEYGIALPEGVMMHIIPEGDHDGHDHGAHEEDGHEEGAHDEDDHEEGDHDEEGHDEEGNDEALAYDPHSWLDPLAFKAQVGRVADLLSTSFPDGAETFAANAAVYVAALEAVDREFEAAFGDNGTCEVTPVASNHNAYAYLSARYGLEFVTVHGLDPEGEPSAEDVAEVVASINEDNITVIFIEEYTDADAVQSIVEQTGVTPLTLYTMELPPMNSDDTYASLMEANLMNLKTGLGCQ